MIESFLAARAASTPIIAILSQDPAATMQQVREKYSNGNASSPVPMLMWDIVNGMQPLNKLGQAVLDKLLPNQTPADVTGNPTECLALATKLPGDGGNPNGGTILFFLNAHRYINNGVPNSQAAVQAIWNLRDRFKKDMRTLVLLAPELNLPSELASDVTVLEEALPDDSTMQKIVTAQFKAAGLPDPEDKVLNKAVDAVRGLAAFPAEQSVAMSLTRRGLDFDSLWQRKRTAIEQTRGLSVDRSRETYDDIGGLFQIKKFGEGLFNGGCPPKVVVRVDEMEKSFGGAGNLGVGDSSGVTQDAHGVILKEMEDNDWPGLIAVGAPGTGKSLISKAFANTFGVLGLVMDLGATKGSYVGQSEQQIRSAMRVIKSVAGYRGALFVATCNKLDAIAPELRRRFRLGIWYFDLPSFDERKYIWEICLKKYDLETKDYEKPDDKNWTGADIRNCCDIAWRLSCSLKEAADFLVPVAKSNPETVESLRRVADGKFLSAIWPGPYRKDEAAELPLQPTGRRISVRE